MRGLATLTAERKTNRVVLRKCGLVMDLVFPISVSASVVLAITVYGASNMPRKRKSAMPVTPAPKPKKGKSTRKPLRKELEKKLWKLTADYVKLRDGCCVTCGATEGLTISHWIKAGKQIVRYDLENCNCQCSACNNAHNYYTYHYDNYMLRHYGEAVLLKLTELAKVNKWKWSYNELADMIVAMQERLDNLIAGERM